MHKYGSGAVVESKYKEHTGPLAVLEALESPGESLESPGESLESPWSCWKVVEQVPTSVLGGSAPGAPLAASPPALSPRWLVPVLSPPLETVRLRSETLPLFPFCTQRAEYCVRSMPLCLMSPSSNSTTLAYRCPLTASMHPPAQCLRPLFVQSLSPARQSPRPHLAVAAAAIPPRL